jgi:hypothetical protein
MSRTSNWATPLIAVMMLTPAMLAAADEKPPHIAWLFPAGGQRGKTVEVAVGGTELAGATAARVAGRGVDGKVVATPNDKAKTLTLSLTTAADAELGQRDLCVQTPAGASNWFHFFVGQLPEVVASAATGGLGKPQALPSLPVLINGQLNGKERQPSDRHFFRFQAKADQTLVFACQARDILPYIADAVPGFL